MTVLRIRLFGTFRVLDAENQPVQVRARKNRALLAVLASAPGKRFSREWLASLLWASGGENQARASLRQALSVLRRELGSSAEVLAADVEAVWLEAGHVDVDLVRLRELADGLEPDSLRAAARLVSGPLLANLALREQGLHDWLVQERQRAHAVAVRVLRRHAFEQGGGDPNAALDDLHRCLELEPTDEAVHRELMRMYAAAGRVTEALQHYEQLRRVLESELGTTPAEETEALAADLRRESQPEARQRERRPAQSDSGNGATVAGPATQPGPRVRYVVLVCGRLDMPTTGDAARDPEEQYAVAGQWLATAEALVVSHGGRFHRRGGTRFLGIFGVEHARGSEAERAARTALDLLERRRHWDGRAKSKTILRCAIAGGRVIAEQAGHGMEICDPIVGQPIELAERLESRAPGNAVLIDDIVRGLLQEHVELVVERFGCEEGAEAWRLDAMTRGAPGAHRGCFVGRAYEVAEIERALESSCREQCVHIVLLRGEAGIGKSRLLEEAGTRARQLGYQWHASALFDFGAAEGEDAIATLVRSLLGQRKLERKSDIDALVEEGILEPDQAPFLLDLLDIPQSPRMRALYSAMDGDTRRRGQASVIAHLVASCCRESPLLMSFDDIHWADAATLRMIADVTRHILDAPVVVLMTTRIEGDPIDRAWLAGTRGVRMLTLDLVALRAAEAREFAARFGAAREDVIEACVERAAGNPLFLVQLLLGARDADANHVPATIYSLVQARLDALDAELRRVFPAAAVLGQHFMPDSLEALLEERPDYNRLLDSYLVHPQGEGYAFSHALIRDAVLDLTLPSRRRELHGRAAQWFRGQDPVLYARHLDSAEDTGAPAAYLEAARQQADYFRYHRAVELIERGLELSVDPEERSRLLMTKGEALTEAGRLNEAIRVLRKAEQEAQEGTVRCRILIDIAAAMRVTDQLDEAFELLDQAEPLAREAQSDIQLGRLCQLRGSLDFVRGHVHECLAWQKQACHLAESAGSPELEASALGGLADGYYALGYLLQAKEAYVRCVQLAEEHGLGRIAVANMVQIGSLRKYLMDLSTGLEDARRAIEFARTVGHHRAELLAHLSRTYLLLETGAVNEMLRHIECAEALIEKLESKRFAPRALHYRAKAHAMLGESERAQELFEQAHRQCREGDAAFVGPSVCAGRALASNDPQTREDLLQEAKDLLDRGALFHNTVEYHRDAIEVALDEADAGTTLALAGGLEAAMSHEPTPFTDCLVERARLLARWIEGDRSPENRAALEGLWQRLQQASFNTLSVRIGNTLSGA